MNGGLRRSGLDLPTQVIIHALAQLTVDLLKLPELHLVMMLRAGMETTAAGEEMLLVVHPFPRSES